MPSIMSMPFFALIVLITTMFMQADCACGTGLGNLRPHGSHQCDGLCGTVIQQRILGNALLDLRKNFAIFGINLWAVKSTCDEGHPTRKLLEDVLAKSLRIFRSLRNDVQLDTLAKDYLGITTYEDSSKIPADYAGLVRIYGVELAPATELNMNLGWIHTSIRNIGIIATVITKGASYEWHPTRKLIDLVMAKNKELLSVLEKAIYESTKLKEHDMSEKQIVVEQAFTEQIDAFANLYMRSYGFNVFVGEVLMNLVSFGQNLWVVKSKYLKGFDVKETRSQLEQVLVKNLRIFKSLEKVINSAVSQCSDNAQDMKQVLLAPESVEQINALAKDYIGVVSVDDATIPPDYIIQLRFPGVKIAPQKGLSLNIQSVHRSLFDINQNLLVIKDAYAEGSLTRKALEEVVTKNEAIIANLNIASFDINVSMKKQRKTEQEILFAPNVIEHFEAFIKGYLHPELHKYISGVLSSLQNFGFNLWLIKDVYPNEHPMRQSLERVLVKNLKIFKSLDIAIAEYHLYMKKQGNTQQDPRQVLLEPKVEEQIDTLATGYLANDATDATLPQDYLNQLQISNNAKSSMPKIAGYNVLQHYQSILAFGFNLWLIKDVYPEGSATRNHLEQVVEKNEEIRKILYEAGLESRKHINEEGITDEQILLKSNVVKHIEAFVNAYLGQPQGAADQPNDAA